MNENQYRSLCEACDRVLLAPDSTIERVAIPWLHVIREHPVFLRNYAELFEAANRAMTIGRWVFGKLRNAAWWLRQCGRGLRTTGQPWFESKEITQRVDVLFVSHLINASHAGQVDDFYFGNLPNELAARGRSVLIALINHTHKSESALASRWRDSRVPRVILASSLCLAEEIVLFRRLKRESSRLENLANAAKPGFYRKVLLRAAQEAISGGALTTLRMDPQIGALVAKLRPEAIVVTHEGHAWERVAFSAARRVRPQVLCIGYQHAALFRLQHAMRRSLNPEFNPDQILTSGLVSKAQLERAPGLSAIPIAVLGSNRTFEGATPNVVIKADRENANHSPKPVCLVLPEGIASECHVLFEFSLACAQVSPEIQFVWRLHPLMAYESLLAQNPKLRNLPKNIVLSKATLDEDIARSGWAMYRGTTAVVQAVVAGLRPIYLRLPDELTIDPLYELKEWRIEVTAASEFQVAVNAATEKRLCASTAEVQTAQKYCEDVFRPFDPQVLFDLVAEEKKVIALTP